MPLDREAVTVPACNVDYDELWELIAVVGKSGKEPPRLWMGQLLRVSYPLGDGPIEMVLGPAGDTVTIAVDPDSAVTRWQRQ